MEGTLPSLAGKLSTIAESKSQDGGLSEPGTARGRSISGQLDNTSRLGVSGTETKASAASCWQWNISSAAWHPDPKLVKVEWDFSH
eukprot:1158758-Pelagomonas_calceolata.AAC.7